MTLYVGTHLSGHEMKKFFLCFTDFFENVGRFYLFFKQFFLSREPLVQITCDFIYRHLHH